MTRPKLLFCSIGLIAAVAGWLTSVPLLRGPVVQAPPSQVSCWQNADSPSDNVQWVHPERPPLAELESDESDTEELSSRDKTAEASSHRPADARQHATLTATCQPKVLTTLNALRVRLQI